MPAPTTATAQCWGGPWDGECYPVLSFKVLALPEHRGEYLLGKRADERGEWNEWTWWQKR
jgi:hypothetical protein